MLGSAADPGDVPDAARRAEQLGFDLVTSGEHVFFHGPTPNAFLMLAAAAAVTERIRLVSTLTLLPLYPMALVAKLTATLDQLSRGRFELGVGVGGEYPPEFEAVGVPVAGRGRRADEALDVLVRLLSGKPVTADGAFGSLRDLRLDPPPVQRPHPPIWVGGRQPAAQRRAARFGDVWMPYMVSPGSFGRSLAGVRTFAEQAGRPAESVRGALFIWGSVDPDRARSRAETVRFVGQLYRQDFEPLADRCLLHGDPDAVLARLSEYQAAGADTVIFSPACAPERRDQVVTTFAEAVLPRL
jgi:probable F420-dependent oxidoreductase